MQRDTDRSTDVLIIGAGPFGLSLAAYLSALGVDHLVVGESMSFWKQQMPTGLLLRSGIDSAAIRHRFGDSLASLTGATDRG
jgi:cation diffusion facilitator CzcD-associated flavoprotein CzcO